MEAESPRSRRKLAAILMVDVSGFSRMMERDEEWTTRAIRAFHARAESRVREHEGRVVDTAGDSVFAEFDSVVNATRCAQAIQEDQAGENQSQPPERRIDTRIGVHVGDVIVEEYKVYGDGVNIAARLESLARPGSILVSEAVYQQVRNKLPVDFRDLGFRELKNIEHPVRVYAVVPSALVAANAPPASVRPPSGREDRRARRLRAARRDWARARERRPEPRRGLLGALLRPDIATLLVIGAALYTSEQYGMHTDGLLPTGGAILLGLTLGRALNLAWGRQGLHLIGLGFGIAAGARLTHWSSLTDLMFGVGGAIVAVQGLARRRRARSRDDGGGPALPPST
ncbi:MAG TPA: adenylate/guanylate cyclase domain-containing protein [Myxococcota bacterium]|nr:adenylate/guanylate cyclase domain-containing protein [Myxococcota bacterium]